MVSTRGIGYFGGLDEEARDPELLPLASTRRTMLADPAYLGVHGLLAPLPLRRLYPKTWEQAREEFAGQVRLVGDLVERSQRADQALDVVAGWLARPLRPDLADLFRHVSGNGSRAVRVLVATLVARALWVQRIASIEVADHLAEVASGLSRPEAMLEKIAAEVQELPDEFVGYLLVEAAMRARHDPQLASVLSAAERHFTLLRPPGEERGYADGAGVTEMLPHAAGRRGSWWVLPCCVAAGISVLTRHVTICRPLPPQLSRR